MSDASKFPETEDADLRSEALRALFQAHADTVRRRLRKVFGDGPPEPDDLVQVAFEKIAARGGVDDIDNPAAFLFRAAVNHGLNQIERRKTARRHVEATLADLVGPIVEEITPETVFSERERLARLQRALSELTPKQKTIVARARLAGETYAQIRTATGWSEADISRQLKAAIAVLQAAVEDTEEDDGTP